MTVGLTRRAISGVKWNGILTAGRAAVQLVAVAMLSRLLAPSDFGLVGMASVVTGLVHTFEDLGLANSVIQNQDTTKEQLSSVFWFNVIFGLTLFVLIWIATPLVTAYYREPALKHMLRWSSTSFIVSPASGQFHGLLRKDLQFRLRTKVSLVALLAQSCISLGLAVIGIGAMSLVWGTLGGAVVSAICVTLIASRSGWLPEFRFHWADLAGFFEFGLYQSAGRALKYLSRNADYLIIGRLLGAEPLGYYTLAHNLMRLPLGYLNPMINVVAFPVFARIQDDEARVGKGYSRILRYLATGTAPTMAGTMVLAHVLIPVVYGPQWLPAVPVVRVFAGLGILLSLGDPIESLLLAKGEAHLLLYLNALAVSGFAASSLVGSRYGILGAAWASLLFTLFVLLPIELIFINRFARLSLERIWASVNGALLAAAVMGASVGAVSAAMSTVEVEPVLEMATGVAFGVIVYTSSLWLFDRDFFTALVSDFEIDRFVSNTYSGFHRVV